MKAMTSFDQLEDRVLLAGNVTTTLAAGVLNITGDDAANDIQIFTRYGQAAGTTEVVIRGNGTSINNGGADWVYTTGTTVTQININMGRGNDTLDVDGLFGLDGSSGNTIFVDGGHGSDTIAVADVNLTNFNVYVSQPLTVVETPNNNPLTDDGNDVVSVGVRDDLFRVGVLSVTDYYGSNQLYVSDVTLTGALLVTMNDDDFVASDTNVVSLARVNSTAAITIATGAGGDNVFLNNVVTTGALSITTGDQNDSVSIEQSRLAAVSFSGEEAADQLNVYNSSLASLTVVNDAGNDVVAAGEERIGLYNSTASGDVSVTTSALVLSGNDYFVTERFFLTGAGSDLSVDLGDGDDVVYQVNGGAYTGGTATFLGGEGNDQLSLNNVNYSNSSGGVVYYGGEGDDQFSGGGNARFSWLTISDSSGTNGFYLSDLTIRNGLTVSASADTQTLLYTARARVLGGATNISLGGGADSVQFLDGTSFRGTTFSLDTTGGTDTVTVNRADFRTSSNFAVALGAGNDTFTANDSQFQINGNFTFAGGPGTNTAGGTNNTRNKAPTSTTFTSFTTFL